MLPALTPAFSATHGYRRRNFQVIDGNKEAVDAGFRVTSPMQGPRIRQLSPLLLIDYIGRCAH